MPDPLNRDHFLAGYLAEAEDHLRASSANLLAVEKALRGGTPFARHVRDLFRSLHTLKGLSAMVGVEPVVEIAHAMETVLRAADRSGLKLGLPAVDVLLKGIAAIEMRVRAVAERKAPPAPPEGLLAALQAIHADSPMHVADARTELALEPELASKLTPAELEQLAEGLQGSRRVVRIDFAPSAARAEKGITITSVRARIAERGEIVKVLPRSVPERGLVFTLLVVTDATDEALAEAADGQPGSVVTVGRAAPSKALASDESEDGFADESLRHGVVRVEVARLDDALEKLSSLVVTRFKLARTMTGLRDRGVDVRELGAALAEMARQLRDLRSSIMRARMVSVSELLERVPLIVRGLTQVTGKPVHLQVDAGKAELDKAVAERIFPAIVHLVRNAVDHALEPGDERERAGKPRDGTISLVCFEHSDSQLELRVSDDGRGIDPEAVARKAGRPTPRTDGDLLDLLAQPGFTTRESASTTSGRGMGLDIVKRIVEALGGEIRLETTKDRGTTFTLRIPLSVSILDAFVFECAGDPFAVPMAMIDEIVEVEAERVFAAPGDGGGVRLLERRGKVMPLFHLATVFGLGGDAQTSRKALVVHRGLDPFAFAVDRMLGQQEVVIRPVEDPLVKVKGVTGTTDLGDGRPTLVVDLLALAGTPRAKEALV